MTPSPQKESPESIRRWPLFGSVGLAAAASICCVGPIVLLSLGITGAWMGNLSALESFRPFFMAFAAVLLLLAFSEVYGSKASNDCCRTDEQCDKPPVKSKTTKIALWGTTAIVAGLFLLPNLLVAGDRAVSEAAVTADAESLDTTVSKFQIEGMTCEGCIPAVRRTLRDVEGISNVEVTFEPPVATVSYEAATLSVDDITHSLSQVGYDATPLN